MSRRQALNYEAPRSEVTVPLKRNLIKDTVASLDVKSVISVAPSATIAEAAAAMLRGRTGCLLVVENDKVVGIFTERDMVKRVLGAGVDFAAMISSVMSKNPTTARMDDPIGSVLQKMASGGYRHLPVLAADGKALGRVSVREIVHYMVEHLPKAIYNLPPKPDQVQVAADGA
jgi:CBS domain-containing protein